MGRASRTKWKRRQRRYQARFEATKNLRWPYRKGWGWLLFVGPETGKICFSDESLDGTEEP